MCFVTKLPRKAKEFNSIWIIVDHLTISSHFLAIWENSSPNKLSNIYLQEIIDHNGVPTSIVSYQNVWFTSWLWKRFHDEFNIWLLSSIVDHQQINGQSEQTIQMPEDMLRAFVIDVNWNWDSYPHLAEFSYNNSYRFIISAPPYEFLYGRSLNPRLLGRGQP